jgi:RimJ/RimL family protein N-acetyltransferase
MRIDGEKVFLTAITYDDCEDFIRWRNSEFIKSRFIYRKDITIEQQRKWIETKVLTGKVSQFIIWDKLDNKKIGSVYLQNIDKDKKEAEYGVLIGEKEYTGKGLGTESANLIIQYGFEQLGLEKIYLRVLKENLPARRAYEKVGFRNEDRKETILIDTNETDVVFMSITRNED